MCLMYYFLHRKQPRLKKQNMIQKAQLCLADKKQYFMKMRPVRENDSNSIHIGIKLFNKDVQFLAEVISKIKKQKLLFLLMTLEVIGKSKSSLYIHVRVHIYIHIHIYIFIDDSVVKNLATMQ